jgi:hypothetical protein
MTVLMGVLPNLFLRPIEPSVERMLNQVRQGAQTQIQADNRPLTLSQSKGELAAARASTSSARALK